MDYNQAMNYIKNLNKEKGMVFGLDAIKLVLEQLGNPQNSAKIIHIAGTNGKGSTGAFLASILDSAGYKVGRFCSPFLFDYKEVFCTYNNGVISYISEDEVASYISLIADKSIKNTEMGMRQLTAFEIETVMAFLYMKDKECDVWIVECGLGGKDDATNVIEDKIMEIITSISLDHMAVLGDTIEQIAQNKCGIISDNSVVISSVQDSCVKAVIEKYCNVKQSKLIFADTSSCLLKENTLKGIVFDDIKHNIQGIRTVLPGEYQLENVYTSVCAAIQLNNMGFNISHDNIKEGISNTHWQGRFDVINGLPLCIVDGAHNEKGAFKLKASIDTYLTEYKKIYVMGVFKDKEYIKILKKMSDTEGTFIAAMSDNPRSLPSDILADKATDYFKNVQAQENIFDAMEKAYNLACEDKLGKTAVVCFGSLSIMKDIYAFIDNINRKRQGRIDRIINDDEFREKISIINEYEKNRVFCCHGMDHLLDVARISWIQCLEKNIKADKEIVYAAALLHDIGRAVQYENGEDHETAGVEIAKHILQRCAFNESEIQTISDIIRFHNDSENTTGMHDLRYIVHNADKISRRCYDCVACNQCKWPSDKKNKCLTY